MRKWEESKWATDTHKLERAQGGSNQEMERKRESNRHSLPGGAQGGPSQEMERTQGSDVHSRPGEGTGRVKSGNEKNANKRQVLTSWRGYREGQAGKWKENEWGTGTYELEKKQGRSSEEMQRKRASNGHTHSGEDTVRVK
jgi:hypothetical protein